MKKVFSSHSELAHVWANQLQHEGRAANMFFNGPVIYSYGHHYEIARFVEAANGQKVCFVNANGYSSSTGKHTAHVWNAIPDGIPTFKVPFLCGSGWSYSYSRQHYFNVDQLPGIVAAMVVEINNLCHDQLKARTNFYSFRQAAARYENIVEICGLFNIPVPNRPENWDAAKEKSDHLCNTQEDRIKAKAERELEKSRELLVKWLNHEYNGQLYNIPVHLRISKDGKLIETTKGAKVDNELALRLLEKLRKGTDVKGEKINGFTLIENTLDHVKIGCHTISWPVINQVFNH
jgi:hypothetical protein